MVVSATLLALLASFIPTSSVHAADPVCTINVSESNTTVQGTNLGDVICITGDNNTVEALGGDDTVVDDGMNNTINLGEGFDTYDGSGGYGSTVDGGLGNDSITGTPGPDEIAGGEGDDTLIGGEEDDTLNGGLGADELTGSAGNDTINGDAGSDIGDGGDGSDLINGGDGNDSLIGGEGNDTLNGGLGADDLAGDAGADEIFGESGSDTLLGGVGDDILAGGVDIDSISGGEGLNTCDYEAGEPPTSTCKYDDEAPVVSIATLEPTTLDSTLNPNEFSISFSIKDQIGLKQGSLSCQTTGTNGLLYTSVDLHFDAKGIRNPSQSTTVLASNIIGSPRDIQFDLSMLLRVGMYPGNYPCALSVTDTLNKTKIYRPFNLQIIRGEGVFDDEPPAITMLSITPNPVDSALSNSEITISWHADDPNDSVGQIQCVQFRNGNYFEVVNLAWWNSGYVMDYLGGPGAFANNRTATHTEFTTRVKIPQDFQPGTYVCGGRQTDLIGNTTYAYPLGSFEIINTRGVYDEVSPTVIPDISNNQTLEVGVTGATASLGWNITDETAYSWGYVSCVSKSDRTAKILDGVTNVNYFHDYGNRQVIKNISGALTSVRYDISFDVPMGTKPGRYLCDGSFTDSLGHWGLTKLGEIVVNRTPPGQPSAPLNLEFTATKPTSGLLSWNLPTSLGSPALNHYLAEYSLDGLVWKPVPNSGTYQSELSLVGLSANTNYWFRVRGENGGTAGQDIEFMSLNWAVLEIRTPAPTVSEAPADLFITNITASGYKLSWLAPTYNGGAVITDYRVEFSSDSGKTWKLAKQLVSTSLSLTVSGAAPGTNYLVRVAAVNAVGLSDYFVGSLSTLITTASAPKSVRTSEITSNSLILSWLLPASNGGSAVTDYKVEVSSNNGVLWSTIDDGVSNNLAVNVSNLLKNRRYLFRVSALNAAGFGSASAVADVITLATVPSAPSALVFEELQSNSVLLKWSAPTDFGGVSLIDYKVETSRDGTSWTVVPHAVSVNRTFKVTGLAPGTTYQTRISAISSMGQSEYLTSTFSTPKTAPTAPRSLSSRSTSYSSLTLSWMLPSSNGGSAITNYKVEVSSNCSTYKMINRAESANLGLKVTGLSAGTQYCFRVSAKNELGYSPLTTILKVTTVGNEPGASSSLSIKAANTSVTLGWRAATVSGGSPVRNYIVEYSKNYGYTWLKVTKPVSTSRTLKVTGLRSRTTYLFRVIAVNDVGHSKPSKTLKVSTG